MEQARKLSDIRVADAPPFRLQISFTFTNEQLEKVQGTYTEIWVSNSQWRQDTAVTGEQRTVIADGDKRWIHVSNQLSKEGWAVPEMAAMFPNASTHYEFESAAEPDAQTRCTVTKPDERKERHAFCFDKTSNLLVQWVAPMMVGLRTADYSCRYGHFQKFADRWYPREMACYVDRHETLHANVEKLEQETSPGAALFTPPQGAFETRVCSSKPLAPQPTFTPDPKFPADEREHVSFVVVGMIVDQKGKVQQVRVVRSGGQKFDDASIRAVNQWRFRPATCNGEAIATEIRVELKFLR